MNDLDKALDAASRVVDVCDTLARITTDHEAFTAEVTVQWAVEMGLIRIGEGITRIPDRVLQQYDGQPWRQIIAMRDFAAHQYDDLDLGRVWRTVRVEVPALRTYLAETLIPGLRAAR